VPQVNRFSRLPEFVQREVQQRLFENGFSEYTEIARELQARGYRISRSSLHRAGKALKDRLRFNALAKPIERAFRDIRPEDLDITKRVALIKEGD
jgi:DNA invertase Pin-like site-specific DNA recombinase